MLGASCLAIRTIKPWEAENINERLFLVMYANPNHSSMGFMGTYSSSALEVSTLPHLEEEGLSAFERYVSATRCYVEYGAGGSTLHAVRMGARHVVSVDSSKDWIDSVRRNLPHNVQVDLLYCNIGQVGAWGRPTNNKGLHAYHAYMVAPWNIVHEKSLDPQLIFIDGRFRVACFLYSLICAPQGASILFDDYMTRKQYHVVEEFCARCDNHGRMAVFQVNKQYSLPAIIARIAEYSIIPD
jgi:predicted RNA methylase